MKPTLEMSLSEWLEWLEGIRPVNRIEMGLLRVQKVWQQLAIPVTSRIFTVAGTNGKGSTCEYLAKILQASGYRVAVYTSPHLVQFNERMVYDGHPISDQQIVDAFYLVESARQECQVDLTYFEFTTLAAWVAFAKTDATVWILEVGLGGRLDAVNAIDADCMVITAIDVDHQEILGNDREKIGYEKAGIMRPNRPVICGDAQLPKSVSDHAKTVGAHLYVIGNDFQVVKHDFEKVKQWDFRSRWGNFASLAYPSLRGEHQLENAATAIAALLVMRNTLPVQAQSVRQGLSQARILGRFQVLPGQPTVILDVGHNPHASKQLAVNIEKMGYTNELHAVFGVMADKDWQGMIAPLIDRIDHWYCCDLETPRAAAAAEIASVIEALSAKNGLKRQQMGLSAVTVQTFSNPLAALTAAKNAVMSIESDKILVFGSFYTVGPVIAASASIDNI